MGVCGGSVSVLLGLGSLAVGLWTLLKCVDTKASY